MRIWATWSIYIEVKDVFGPKQAAEGWNVQRNERTNRSQNAVLASLVALIPLMNILVKAAEGQTWVPIIKLQRTYSKQRNRSNAVLASGCFSLLYPSYLLQSSRAIDVQQIERTKRSNALLASGWFSFLHPYLCQNCRGIERTNNSIRIRLTSGWFSFCIIVKAAEGQNEQSTSLSTCVWMVLFPVSVYLSKQQTDRKKSSRVIERTAKENEQQQERTVNQYWYLRTDDSAPSIRMFVKAAEGQIYDKRNERTNRSKCSSCAQMILLPPSEQYHRQDYCLPQHSRVPRTDQQK